MIYTTVAWQYFPLEKQRDGLRSVIETTGNRATQIRRLPAQMEDDAVATTARR
jgi:hypothetical protein